MICYDRAIEYRKQEENRMKKQAKRWLLILGLCGTMSLTMYGCGSENLSSEEEQTEPLDESQEEPK